MAANLTITAGSYGPIGVGLDANGRVVAGAGNTGLMGVLVKRMPVGAVAGSATITPITAPGALAGDIVDVMTDGEITDVSLVAGTAYWADVTTGVLAAGQAGGAKPGSGTGSGAGSKQVGWTVEATRLVVRFGRN